MRKIVVYIYEGMATFEIALLAQLLGSDPGIELIITADELRLIKDKSGMLIMPHTDLKSVHSEDIDGIIIPGGWLADLDEHLISIIRDLKEEQKLIAAVCAGSSIMARSGVLKGIRYTTSIVEWQDKHRDFFKIEDPFPRESYVECRAIRDGNIITAKGSAFIDFTMEVCDYFDLFEDEDDKKAFEQDLKGGSHFSNDGV